MVNMLASQAKDDGSIPLSRSKYPYKVRNINLFELYNSIN